MAEVAVNPCARSVLDSISDTISDNESVEDHGPQATGIDVRIDGHDVVGVTIRTQISAQNGVPEGKRYAALYAALVRAERDTMGWITTR